LLRGLERRLCRLEDRFDRFVAERGHERGVLKARKIIAQAIRAGLAHTGIDPDKAPPLRRFEQPDWPHPQMTDRPAAAAEDRSTYFTAVSSPLPAAIATNRPTLPMPRPRCCSPRIA